MIQKSDKNTANNEMTEFKFEVNQGGKAKLLIIEGNYLFREDSDNIIVALSEVQHAAMPESYASGVVLYDRIVSVIVTEGGYLFHTRVVYDLSLLEIEFKKGTLYAYIYNATGQLAQTTISLIYN